VAVAWYVFSGRVTTDDAQVDCHITAVAPQVPGYVVQLFINDNTLVKEGDVLVQIDPRTYQAEVEQAKASLDIAVAQANSAKLQIGLTRETTTTNTSGATAQKDSDAADYASYQETQLANVAAGQKALLRLDTYREQFEGVVDSIAGATGSRQALLPPQNATGNFIKVVQRIPVKILVKPSDNPHLVLRPGMNVEATIYTR
jgi:multidrug resistance efflux pump